MPRTPCLEAWSGNVSICRRRTRENDAHCAQFNAAPAVYFAGQAQLKVSGDYFEQHGLKLFIARLLMEIGESEPEDPYYFMAKSAFLSGLATTSLSQCSYKCEKMCMLKISLR